MRDLVISEQQRERPHLLRDTRPFALLRVTDLNSVAPFCECTLINPSGVIATSVRNDLVTGIIWCMRLYLMQLGMRLDGTAHIPGYLVQTDDGQNILIDSGLPRSLVGKNEVSRLRSK